MKRIAIFFVMIFIYHSVISQNSNKKLIGVVLDSLSNQPLPFATIQLTNTSLKLNTIADENGNYTFKKISEGNYEIMVSYVGYRSKRVIVSIGEAEETVAPKLSLSLENINLKEVTVKALRPFIEQSMDKIVLNVAESIMANSGSSLDILRRSPSVQLNENDGSISLKGKKVMILVDGKLTQLTGESLEGFLSAMPSNSIDRIELVSNPSAKYEAAGMAVINIRTLKMKSMGLNGSWGLGTNIGKFLGYNGNILFNYRKNKITFIGNYSHQFIHQYVRINSFRTLSNQLYFDDFECYNRSRRLQFYKVGLDYDLTSKTTLGILFQGNENGRNTLNTAQTLVGKNNASIDSTITIDTESKAKLNNWNSNLSLRHQFAQKGRSISIDTDYGQYNTDWNDYFTQKFFKNSSNIEYKPTNQIWFPWFQKNQIRSLKSDYVHPFKSSILESGLQFRNTQMNMHFEVQEKIGSQWIKQLQNSFDYNYNYNENVQAAYVSYGGKKNKLTYQTGLRYEQTQINLADIDDKSTNSQNYGNLFPSLGLQYVYSKKQTITISYTKRITRPSYSQLNERPIYFNPYRQTIGNAYLKPTINSSIEVGLNLNQNILFTLGYQDNKDDITLVPTLVGSSTQYKYYNFNKSETISFDIVVNKNIKPWWSTNTGFQYFHVSNNFQNIQELTSREGNSFYFRSSNYFTLHNGIKIEIIGFYYPPQESGAFKILNIKKLDIGLQKPIMKKKADLRLTITDVFNTYTARYLFFTNTTYGDEEIKTESRFVKFSFLYRFGNLNLKFKDKKSGIDRESSRIEK